ncbi:deleted in malignant brain tumors 1 protein-like [Patiria miniata]|uniref:Uncharacterized protein n=1 Tax=Patiria miniata TaxID=46514 RepID=A0A913ZTH4_PATMI|nr:deleted in malignant brain tumors 1 protein-like [Patiria miniata]XP_038054903.1 deleted in malignant brain tumors 1 protein-like [Patiria miniata]
MSLHPSSRLSIAALVVLTFAGIVHVAGEVRLVNSSATVPNAGRVEVWDPDTSEWLAVCANDWDFDAGQVVCKELGYPGTTLVKIQSEYGDGGPGKSIGGFDCTGDEAYLLSCTSNDPNDEPCGASYTAGVVCAAPGYEGCKMEMNDNSRIFKTLTSITDNTVEKCIEFAKARQDGSPILYAGVLGEECSYGLKNPENIASLPAVDDSMCDTACPGNPDQRCGGSGLISVYSVNGGFCSGPVLSNGEQVVQPTPDFFYFGTVVDFTCNPGFELQGAPSVQCVMGSSGTAQVTWNNFTPECFAADMTTSKATAHPGGNGAEPGTAPPGGNGVDAGLVLGILNTVILVTSAIAIGIYCSVIRCRKREGSPALPDGHARTGSVEKNSGDEDDQKPTASPPGPDHGVVQQQELREYSTVIIDDGESSTARDTRTNSQPHLYEQPTVRKN